MYERWLKLKSGYVSDSNERIGLITWWTNNAISVIILIRGCVLKIFERDFPFFSDALPSFFTWLSDYDFIGGLLTTPFAFISFGGFLLTYFSVFIRPRKQKAWKEVILFIGVFYIVLDIPVLVLARIMNLPILEQSFFWSQIFFDFLMLFLLILKIQIMNIEKNRSSGDGSAC